MNISKTLFLGFFSIPLNQKDRAAFIDKQIKKNLFDDYKAGLEKLGGDVSSNLFNPQCYYLWGRYDGCAISEVDDLEFATRIFRPYVPIRSVDDDSSEFENFDYKVIRGINSHILEKNSSLKLPYIGISQLKINSAFLLGNGLNLSLLVREKIAQLVKDEFSSDIVKLRITESLSYYELVIILESSSITKLKMIISRIRSLQVNEISDDTGNLYSNSLFPHLHKGVANGFNELSNHLFDSTLTTFGVHQDFFNKNVKWDGIDPESEEIYFISKWNIKPGHFKKVVSLIENDEQVKLLTTSGRGDLTIIKKVSISSDNIDNDNGLNPFDFPGNTYEDSDISEHIVDTYTTLGFENLTEPDFDASKHFDIHKEFERFKIKPKTIADVRQKLKQMKIPKVLSEKVLKLFSNYNSAVINPDMYSSFIELYYYINESIVNSINEYHKGLSNYSSDNPYKSRRLIDKLESACNCLEVSFSNRYYQSVWMFENLEVNIDYSGGIHGLIASYDSCFKALNNAYVTENRDSSFVYIRSDHTVSATPDAMLLNYLHLIQPYIFCSIVFHETSNFIVEKWFYSNLFETSESKKTLKTVLSLFYQAGITPEIVTKEYYEIENLPKLFSDQSRQELKNKTLVGRYRLYDLINEDTLTYFYRDYNNYIWGYSEDYELFCKTSWNYFIQLGNIYDRNEEINLITFITMSIRLQLIRQIANADLESSETFINGIYPEELNKFAGSLIDICGDEIEEFVTCLLGIENFRTWFESWKNLIDNNTFSNELDEKEYCLLEELKHEIYNWLQGDNHDFSKLSKHLDDYIRLNKIDEKPNVLLPVYKYVIKNCLSFHLNKYGILNRSFGDGTPECPPKDYLDLITYIDPCGGTFVMRESDRIQYMNYRTNFIRLFSHLSFIYKKDYITRIVTS